MTSTASLVALYTEGASTTCSRLKRTRTENQVTVKELEAIGRTGPTKADHFSLLNNYISASCWPLRGIASICATKGS